MELRHLRYFVAVAEELNFTRAAARLHIAQPPLSVQIRKLEAEVGADLLLRQGRQIALSDAGRAFLSQARETLASAGLSVALARRAALGEVGHLAIGYNTVAEFEVFPKVMPVFRKKWPDVHVSFHGFETSRQLEALRRGEVDVGFIWLPFPSDEFDVQELATASLVAVIPAAHRLAAARAISINDLSNEPLLIFPRSVDPQTYHQIEELFLGAGAMMNVQIELDSLLSIINFVAMGSGCALVPQYLRGLSREGIVYRPLHPKGFVKRMAIVKRKDAAQVADAFYRFTVDALLRVTAEPTGSGSSAVRKRS